MGFEPGKPVNVRALQRTPAPRPSAPPAVNPDRQDAARGVAPYQQKAKPQSRPAPAPKRTGVFSGVRPATAPLTTARVQAHQRTQQARAKLPPVPIAAPPIIDHPTRAQVTAAKTQLATSINAAVGAGGTGAQRNARRDQILQDIRTEPRYAHVKASIDHWLGEESKLNTTEARLRNKLDTIKPGPPPHKVHAGLGPVEATVNLTALGSAISHRFATATPGLHTPDPESQYFKNALSDIAHLPLMAPQTAYAIGDAALSAAHGDTKKAKQLASSFTQGVYGHAIRGDWTGLEDYFRNHPVYAALEIRGGIAAPGRGLGSAMRSGALGKAAARAASTERVDIPLAEASGSRVAARQHYSPDVFSKLFQVMVEKMRGGAGKTMIGDHRLRRRADMESDMAAATSRAVRGDEGHQAKAAKPKGALADVVGLVVQGVVRPAHVEADLHKELARLDAAHVRHEYTTIGQRKQNRATAAAIEKVIGDPAAMRRVGQLVESGRRNTRAINDLESKAIGQGALSPDRAARAKLFPAAQAHLGAEYSDAPFKAARGREVAAGRDLRAEHTRLSQRVSQARDAEQAAAAKVKTLSALHASQRGAEAHHGPVAAYYVGQQRFTLRKDAEDAAQQAGVHPRSIQRVALTTGESKRVGDLSLARRQARNATQRRRAAESDLRALNKRGQAAVPARQAFEAARAERQAAQRGGTESLNVAGQRLPNSAIEAAVGEPVAHLPHHTQNRGARAYYQTAFAGRKNLDASKKRTGAAFAKGAVDVSYQAVTEHRVRLRGVVNRIAEHDKIIHSMAITGEKTPSNPYGLMSWNHVEKLAENAKAKGINAAPYRAVPGSYDWARIQRIAETQGAEDAPELGQLIGDEFNQRLKPPPDGEKHVRNAVLLPAEVINQLKAQHAVSGATGRVGNVAADVFRRTVLPFSAKWLTGNLVEAGVRLALVGAGPNSRRIGKALLTELDRVDHDQAIRVRAALTGGLLYGNKGLTVRRFAEHFQDTPLEKSAKAVSLAGQLPVVHQLGQLMKGYTDWVFHFNRVIEANAQYAALGKWAHREMQEMTGSWAKATRAQQAALHDLANGLQDTKNIHDAARYIDETLGQYSRFSPSMRRVVQQAAPFLPWYVNAVRFTYWTLPAKHPIKVGLYALLAQNLQADYDASHKDLPPGGLKGAIVTGTGSTYDVGRYTPFGLSADVIGGGSSALIPLTDPFFPGFKSAFLAAFGMNFAGRQAVIPASDSHGRDVPFAVRATMALNSLLEAYVPAIAIARRAEEGGRTPYDNSTVLAPKSKAGTEVAGGAANRILNPFRPAAIKGNPSHGFGTPAAQAEQQAAPQPEAAPAAPQSLEDRLRAKLNTRAQQGPSDLEQRLRAKLNSR